MTAYLVWFLLFALYLIVLPLGISPFETPKVVIAEIIIDLILLSRIINFKKAHLKHLWTPQTILLGVIFLLSLDQLLLFHPPQSFFGNPYRLQGMFLIWHLMFFSFISKDILISHIHKYFYYLSFILLFLATVILGVNQNLRAFGFLGEPNALAATTLFIFPFVFTKSRRLTKIAVLGFTLLLIFLSGSRAGMIGLGIEALFIVSINFFKLSFPKAITGVVLLILLTLTLPFTESAGWFENRSQIWQTAIQAGFTSPILGQGFGNIQNPIHASAIKLNNPVQYQVVDSAHNFILDWWIQGGAVGVISILILISLTLKGLTRHKKAPETTALLGLITAMLFNPVSVINLLAFWWLIGQGFSDN